MNIFVHTQDWIFLWSVKICSFFCLLYPLAVLWTGALLGRKLPLNEHVCAYSFCVEWKFVPFTHLLCCELAHSQPTVSYHSVNMFVHTHFVLSKIHSFFYLLYPLAVLWTDALSDCKLPLNGRVCAYSFCVEWNPFLLYQFAVLWTCALLDLFPGPHPAFRCL